MLGDGVDRSHPIASFAFIRLNPGRVNVIKGVYGNWLVIVPFSFNQRFPTHAEAIAYADRMARS